jgi:hypothetical protein
MKNIATEGTDGAVTRRWQVASDAPRSASGVGDDWGAVGRRRNNADTERTEI